MDAARMAVRLGADEVHITCLESRRKMPAYEWEFEAALREGVKMHPALAPQKFTGNNGRVTAIEFKRAASTRIDRDGRVGWTLKEGAENELTMPADAVIIAIGQTCDASCFTDKLKVSGRGTFLVDPDTLETSIPGIYAAGDAVTVIGTVTESMAAGRKAAVSIDRYLRGLNPGSKQAKEKGAIKISRETIPDWFARKARWEVPRLAPADAVRCFEEVNLRYTPWEAVEEARRCLNCRTCAKCIFDRDQICFETGSRLLSPK